MRHAVIQQPCSPEVVENVAMDVGEQDLATRGGGSHKREYGVDRFAGQVVGHSLPEEEGAFPTIESDALQGVSQLPSLEVDGYVNHRVTHDPELLQTAALVGEPWTFR